MKRWKYFILLSAIALLGAVLIVACSNGDGSDGGNGNELDIAVCAPDNGPFSLDIDNEWFPLPVGQEWVLEGEGVRVEITVLDEAEEVAGVITRIVEEAEYEDDEVVEISRNFFVQAPDGTVCYYGEDVDIYEDGQIVSHAGSWRAGEGENLPGIIMPADPEVGMVFHQEYAPGIAEDMCEILAFGETVDTPAGEFTNTMRVQDWNPLEDPDEKDIKYYARGIGLIVDEDVELTSY